ncbi:DUF1146 family protein [Marinicrinis lubricantis]|uniref:DUF1146 family protein n=1 Tax=Marinicrinis lubricantis TaxID=2086470 RepID=A0ABW1IKK5_9BACL
MTMAQDLGESLRNEAAQTGMIYITVNLISIALCWWCLQTFRFDLFVKQPKSGQAKMLQVILAVILGYQLAQFILSYAEWSSSLQFLF